MRWVLLVVFVLVFSLALFAFLASTLVSTDAEKFNNPAKQDSPPDPSKMQKDMERMRETSKKLKLEAQKKTAK